MLGNPGALWQTLARDNSVLAALARLDVDRANATVLDVGCGSGYPLALLLRAGFLPKQLHGIDIMHEGVLEASRVLPSANVVTGDAASLPYRDGVFDLTMESTMFCLLPEGAALGIAAEMRRVTRPGGYIVLTDWRYGRAPMKAVTRRRIARLFPGCTSVVSQRGALIPPVGRFLSAQAPSLYFVVAAVLPALVGMRTVVLRCPIRA